MSISKPEELRALLGIDFSDEQLAAITTPLAPSLIVAGAGTGKTTVMAARVVWLVATKQVRPEAVLGLTFTRRAAAELDQRIADALAALYGEPLDDGPVVATYDAFVGGLLEGQGMRLGAFGRLMTDAEPYQLATQVAADPGFQPQLLHRLAQSSLADRMLHLDQQMASHLVATTDLINADNAFIDACANAPLHGAKPFVDVAKAAQTAAERIELARFAEAYSELKVEKGCAEFSDQQAAVTRLVLAVPQVGAALRAQFSVVLLDEYQDTSAAQTAMLAGLFSGPDMAHGRGHPVSAVGDPLQAIYGWRGAACDNMGQFASLFPMPQERVFPLTINRRSGNRIVAVANAVASQMKATLLQPDTSLPPGMVEARLFSTRPQEVASVAARIVEAHRLGQAQRWSDAAILVRRNADIPDIYSALVLLDAPVEIVGLGGLLALPEIASVVAMASLAVSDDDNPAVALLVSGPACSLGPADMAALARRSPQLLEAVFDPVGVSQAGQDRLRRLADRIRAVRRHRHEPVADLVQIAADELGLTAELAVPSPWSAALGAQMRRLITHVSEHAARVGDITLPGLLAWLEAENDHGDQLDQATPSAQDSVKLLTVHKAKGLEWSVVALPGLCAGVFPNDRLGDNPLQRHESLPYELRLDAGSLPSLRSVSHKGIGEFTDALRSEQVASEDRLAYVAVSRAKSLLLASASYWWPGRTTPAMPSRLFDLIAANAELVDLADAPGGPNPLNVETLAYAWPPALDDDEQARLDQAASVVAARRIVMDVGGLSAEDSLRVDGWRGAIDAIESQAGEPLVSVPGSISASALVAAHRDTEAFYEDIARPMPHISDAGATRGTLFHRWVEQRFTSSGRPGTEEAPAAIEPLIAAFEAGPYADRTPVAVETPFVAVIAGQQVRGRIDAVYQQGNKYQVVDWKTSSGQTSDDAQLAVYRLAWAQMAGCSPDDVDAVFYYVATKQVVRPARVAASEIDAWVDRLRAGKERV